MWVYYSFPDVVTPQEPSGRSPFDRTYLVHSFYIALPPLSAIRLDIPYFNLSAGLVGLTIASTYSSSKFVFTN